MTQWLGIWSCRILIIALLTRRARGMVYNEGILIMALTDKLSLG